MSRRPCVIRGVNTETKNLDLALVDVKMSDGDSGNGVLEGYASVKNVVDSYGDVIRDGAYSNIDELIKNGWSGVNHDGNVGYFLDAKEDNKGLWVKVAYHSDPESQKARKQVQERLAAGKGVGMSIMYRTIERSDGEIDGMTVRELKKIEVVEAGAVWLPAAKQAQVTGVKQGSGVPLDQQFKAARESAADLAGRVSELNEMRKNGLNQEVREQAREMATKWSEIADALDGKAETVDEKVLETLKPGW